MTQQIGDVFVSAIEEVNQSTSVGTDEIDILDSDSNTLLLSDDEGRDIEISFVVVNDEAGDIERREERLKNLPSNDIELNYIDYQGKEGRISVEEVTFPDEAQRQNILEGEVSGRFLPWPKHYPNEEPIIYFLNEDIRGNLLAKGNSSLLLSLDGWMEISSNLEGDAFVLFTIKGSTESSLFLSSDGGYGTEYGSSYGIGEARPVLSLVLSIIGNIQSGLDSTGKLYLLSDLEIESSLNSVLSISADMEVISGYGNNYGFRYGN